MSQMRRARRHAQPAWIIVRYCENFALRKFSECVTLIVKGVVLVAILGTLGIGPERSSAAGPMTVDEFQAAPPIGQSAEVLGYVVDSYLCPPCPAGAMCKPCARESVIFVAAAPGHPAVDVITPPADVLVVATRQPQRFELRTQYRLVIAVDDRREKGRDGRLRRSQRAELDAVWIDEPGTDSR